MSNKPKRNFPEDPFEDPIRPDRKGRTLGFVEIAIAIAALAIGAYYLIQIVDEGTVPSVTPVVVEVTATPISTQDLFDLAKGLYDVDNFERAEEAYTQAITMAREEQWQLEDYIDALYYRGVASYNIGKYEQAIADLGKAIDADHDLTVFAYYYRGRSYQELGSQDISDRQSFNEKALEDYKISSELCMADQDRETMSCDLDWQRRGEVNIALQRYDIAIDAFERALEIQPDNIDAVKGLLKVSALINDSNNPELLAYYDALLADESGGVLELENVGEPIELQYATGTAIYKVPVTVEAGETLHIKVEAVPLLRNSNDESSSSLQNAAAQPRLTDYAPLVVITNEDGTPFAFGYSDEKKVVELDLDGLPADNYIVKIRTTDGTTNGRVRIVARAN